MNEEKKETELNVEQMDSVIGGIGKPKPKLDKSKVICQNCGTENEIPSLLSPAWKPTCSKCGAELEL